MMNPLRTAAKRCVTLPRARLGWILILIGFLCWQGFGRHADWRSVFSFRGPLERTDGKIIQTSPIGFTLGSEESGDPILAVQFTFTGHDGVQRQGTSWTEKKTLRSGQQVSVEYAAGDPMIARIAGMRSGPLPIWIGAVLLFPAVGLWCIVRVVLFPVSTDSMEEG